LTRSSLSSALLICPVLSSKKFTRCLRFKFSFSRWDSWSSCSLIVQPLISEVFPGNHSNKSHENQNVADENILH
jgi:hypothetical protein